jgi:hypothetical protein
MLVAGAKASAYGPVARALAFLSAFGDSAQPVRRLLAPANAGKMASDLNVDVLSGDGGTPPAGGHRSLPESLPQHRNAATDGRG